LSFDWNIESELFSITNLKARVNADMLFVSLLMEIEKQEINIHKSLTISDIPKLIPKGTAGVDNPSTYPFSILSMLSGQNHRDYFVFENADLRDEFTKVAQKSDRDNYYWLKEYPNEKLWISPKYIKS
jgi:5-methylcytosine-specific restriction protein A